MLEFVHTYEYACMGLLWQVERVTHTHLAFHMMNQSVILLLPFYQNSKSSCRLFWFPESTTILSFYSGFSQILL